MRGLGGFCLRPVLTFCISFTSLRMSAGPLLVSDWLLWLWIRRLPARAERQGEERAVLPVGQTFRFPASAQRRGLPRVWAACTCCELIFLGRRLRRRTGTADEQLVYLFAELVVQGQSLRCD